MMYGNPIRERTVEELKHGIKVGDNTVTNLRAAVGENHKKDKEIERQIEDVNKTIWGLKKELARKGGG